nr:hypothetical protein [Microbacterium barkeri]
MAQSATTTARHNLARAAGLTILNGAHSVRPRTLKTLRKMGFAEGFIQQSMDILNEQIRTTGEGQVMMLDARRGPFGPAAIVETGL